MLIVVDAGHGGTDPGAVGPNKVLEKSINLKVAKMLRKELGRRGHVVEMTRIDDFFVPLTVRGQVANHVRADAFISLHCNATTNRSVTGIEVWTTVGKTKSDVLAEYVIQSLMKKLPNEVFRCDMSDGDHDKEKDYTVLFTSRCPAILIEMGFISNPDGERKLTSQQYQEKLVEAIADGVERFAAGGK
jgi:N-acetylmuramoyl-L-alanine amidase